MKLKRTVQKSSKETPDAPALTETSHPELEDRILVWAPDRDEDDFYIEALCKAHLDPCCCDGIGDLCSEISQGAGLVVLGTEALSRKGLAQLQCVLSAAPAWSALPLLVAETGSDPDQAEAWRRRVLDALGAVTFFPNDPVERRTLVAMAKAALRVRRRQYEVRDLLQQEAVRVQQVRDEMDAFTYSVSHDLRAPLRAIRGFSQALAEDYGRALDEPGRDYLERVGQAADHAERLIQDLLQFSRLGRATLTLGPVSLESAVRQALHGLAPEMKNSPASVNLRKPLPQVMADEAILQQVLASLLSNAIKFVAPGVKPRVQIWASDNAARVRLWISDNGIGIAPNYHERIFKVFERLHGPEMYPGTGMGLAIVSKGMARMGGTAGLESMPGKGSQFWIELPGC
ncbi:MAG: ATP-binding protein [Verrucomicrobiia bacterium]